MSWRRRAFTSVVGAGALCLSMAAAVSAETWRMASKMPPDSPEGLVFQYFADKVAEHSNGELDVKVFPNEQLGKTDAVMEQGDPAGDASTPCTRQIRRRPATSAPATPPSSRR